jgi:hypothetical protein
MSEKTALKELETLVPPLLLGGGLGYVAGRMTAPKKVELKEQLAQKLRKAITTSKDTASKAWDNPAVRVGAGVGGTAAVLLVLRKLLSKEPIAKHPSGAPTMNQSVVISGLPKEAMFRAIGSGVGRAADFLAGKALKPITSPIQTAKVLGQGAQRAWHGYSPRVAPNPIDVIRKGLSGIGIGKGPPGGVRWWQPNVGLGRAADMFRNYTGLNTHVTEIGLNKLVKQDPAFGAAMKRLMAHTESTGAAELANPKLLSTLMDPAGSLSQKYTQGGRMRWLVNRFGNPREAEKLLFNAPDDVKAAYQTVMAKQMPIHQMQNIPGKGWQKIQTGTQPLADHVRKGTHSSFLLAAGVPLAFMAPSMFGESSEEKPVATSPFDKEQDTSEGFIPGLMGGVGRGVGKYSPGMGNWIEQHPYLSAGAGAAGLGALGYGAYNMFKAKRDE